MMKNYLQIIITLVISLILSVGMNSCKNSDKEINKIELVKKYFKHLNHPKTFNTITLFTDSLWTKEGDYEQIYSLNEYQDWLKWDAIFEPTYKILQIKQEDSIVIVNVSKIDKRISFLHGEPIITKQLFQFNHDKISSIETYEYINFKEAIFIQNRNMLLSWVEENHPELNGFLYDQSEKGATKYLNAIHLFNNRK